MRILQVSPFLTPRRGGSVMVPYHLSKALVKRGHDVTLITTDFEFDQKFASTMEGVKVFPFRSPFNIGLFILSPEMDRWLSRNIGDFDIVHMHNFRSFQNNSARRWAVRKGVPYLVQAHGSVLKEYGMSRAKALYDIVWGTKLIRGADKLVAVSKLEADQYLGMGGRRENVEIIPNAISFPEVVPTSGEFRKKLGIDPAVKIVLFVGRVHRIKGLDLLVRSFSSISNDRNDVVLVIAGPNDGYLEELQAMVKDMNLDRVIFADFIENVYEACKDADVLVYPSYYEIFGLVPFESIMAGTPTVVSDGCGCAEIIKEESCGLVFQNNNEEDLRGKIERLLSNPQEGERMVEQGRVYIANNLTWERIVRQVEALYEGCLVER